MTRPVNLALKKNAVEAAEMIGSNNSFVWGINWNERGHILARELSGQVILYHDSARNKKRYLFLELERPPFTCSFLSSATVRGIWEHSTQ